MTKKKPGAVKGRPPKYGAKMDRLVRLFVPDDLRAVAAALGDGNISDGIRVALARQAHVLRGVEVWQHVTTGQRCAVLREQGRPIAGSGPLDDAAAARVMAGDTAALVWESGRGEAVAEEDEAGDVPAYQRVWPEGERGVEEVTP